MTFAVAAVVFALDRITKIIAVSGLEMGKSLAVWPGIFHITLVHNTGAAFGLLRGFTLSINIISCLVAAFIIYFVLRNRPKDAVFASALGLVLGGALGNIWDRARFGYVIDFLDFRIWPVFNVADTCLTIGLAVLVFKTLSSKDTV